MQTQSTMKKVSLRKGNGGWTIYCGTEILHPFQNMKDFNRANEQYLKIKEERANELSTGVFK